MRPDRVGRPRVGRLGIRRLEFDVRAGEKLRELLGGDVTAGQRAQAMDGPNIRAATHPLLILGSWVPARTGPACR
jgi:hypothetical protein